MIMYATQAVVFCHFIYPLVEVQNKNNCQKIQVNLKK